MASHRILEWLRYQREISVSIQVQKLKSAIYEKASRKYFPLSHANFELKYPQRGVTDSANQPAHLAASISILEAWSYSSLSRIRE